MLQDTRLAELLELPDQAIDDLIAEMQTNIRLPKMDYHFEDHGTGLGVATVEEYREEFLAHVVRQDLRLFTGIRAKDGARMWYLIGMDTAYVAQYNQSKSRYWSFFKCANLEKFLKSGRDWWIEVVQTGEGWRFEKW